MSEASPVQLLEALARLNHIGAAINRGPTDLHGLEGVLRLIVQSAADLIAGSSAVIYTCNDTGDSFILESRVATQALVNGAAADDPRPDGMGMRAISQRRRVLSYTELDLEIHPAKITQGAEAVVCYPLIVATENLGVLYVNLHQRKAFTELELLILDNFVNLTAMTLAAARRWTMAEQEQSRKERELRRLRRAGLQISSRSSLRETLDVILHLALDVIDAKYGIFRLVDPSGTRLVTQAIVGERLGSPATEVLPLDEHSIMGLAALRRETLVIADLSQEPWNSIYYPFDRELEMRSEVAVPLVGASGRLEGVLNLESPQLSAFSKQDRYILQIFATYAVTAIQEVRLLDALQEISALLLSQPVEQMHRSLVEKAADLLDVPISLIWLVQADQLVLQACSKPELCGRRLAIETSLTGQVILQGQALTASLKSTLSPTQPGDLVELQDCNSALIVPLFASHPRGGSDVIPIGAFSVYSATGTRRDFSQSEWDKKVLSILGHYAALALDNASRQEALQAAQEQRVIAEAFAAVGDIASNLLHKLNNKIGTIPVRIDGIWDKSRSQIQADPYLEKNLVEIEKSAAEALDVVRESLQHLRPIEFTTVCVADCVNAAIAAVTIPAGVELRLMGLAGLPCVNAGPQSLTLVFTNLLENAVDALQGSGLITINGTANTNLLVIEVSDTGPGIPPAIHERIFELNYSTRAMETPTRLGFGLWWVKTMLARLGGSVSVISDGQSGTTFRLEFPPAETGKP